MKQLLIGLVRIYQKTISYVTPARCRFYPTCSHYTIEAIEKHGIVSGLWLSFRRICRCHPWNPGGLDPVPDTQRKKNNEKK
ncbi:MAG: membrane protein insertion efficiency factor YidD [Kiritimatiellaceae bacterium]|nr:membrane protein insertion efficiency factor YidD [Kiritimatiellaceae bacterium]